MIKMSFLVVSILSVPMAYYFWMGGWDTIPGASPPELASFNSKPIIPPPKSSTEEETGERAAQRDAQTPIPAPAVASPTATTDRTAMEAQTPIPAPTPTATTERTVVEAQTPIPVPGAASPTATTSRTAVAPASEQNVTPSDQRDADEIVVLLKRGQELMRHGDLAAARLVLRHAADAKNAEAALTLGATYDPVTLRELRVYGVSADVGTARTWYEKAKELGSPEAARRLEILAR
jgi:TPR repeat protein